MKKGGHVVIVGAGIVGVSTAIWLQRAGCRVTLIDREGPAAGTSYGNAGILAAAALVPVLVPATLKKVPAMLLDPNQPLFLRWSYLPELLPFLARYGLNARDKKVQKITASLADLLLDTVDQHLALAAGTSAETFIEPGDYVFGYRDKATFAADRYGWALRKKYGIFFEEMDADALADYDPALKGCFGYSVRCSNHGHIKDPGAYVTALADHVVTSGGELVIASVENVVKNGDLVQGVMTKTGLIEADHVVIAGGVWSGSLMSKLGLDVPMESERGYHIEFVNPSYMPKVSTMVNWGKFAITPMNGRLRCAGIVEFGGVDAPPGKAPFALLKRQVKALMPDLAYDSINEWMGHRPSTIDSLPLIGPVKNADSLWAGFGHQHIGLTGGPKTGRWLADMILGKKINTNLAPFAPDRFGC